MTALERLMHHLPHGWRVVVQPSVVMGHLWGCCFFWPRTEIWIAVRDPEPMLATLVHEVAHALTPHHQHDQVWYRAACALWGEVFPDDRQGFADTITEYLDR
jgi:hypothetical protein